MPRTSGRPTSLRLLEIVQIDHTQMDVVVVDEEKREAMESPWLTLTIDVFTGMITGFYVSMSAPSRASFGLCMLRATFEKTAWLAEQGIETEWHVTGLPEIFLVGNGSDFRSAVFRKACENDGVSVEYRLPGKPWFGGPIERLIGTMMKDVLHFGHRTRNRPTQPLCRRTLMITQPI